MNLFVIIAVIMSLNIDTAWSTKLFNQQSTFNGDCVSGDGRSYRGTVSRSETGRMCLNWEKQGDIWGASVGIGNHNYCRNPNHKLRPWCKVKKGNCIVEENCNIPKCSPPSVKLPAVQPEDTELTCGQTSKQSLYKIVGGSFTPIESQPWVAAIFHNGTFLCGGSLIAPCWVLTAAHCFHRFEPCEKDFTVYLGKSAINTTNASKEQKFMVKKLVMHRRFNANNFNNDIALLKITNKDRGCAVKTSTTRNVCLPPFRTQLLDEFPCITAGYGYENPHVYQYSNILKKGRVNLLSQSKCRRTDYYGDKITENMLCAADPKWNIDSCGGDSGGPLVCDVGGRMFLFGIVSWGESCAKRNKPGVYTKVTNYNKWIAKKTGLSQYTAGIMYPKK